MSILKLIRFSKWLCITLVMLIVSLYLVLLVLPIPYLMTGLGYSRAVYDDQNHLLRLTLSPDAKYRLMTPLAKISPQMIASTLLQEDQYFYWHPGINPISLLKAGWSTYGSHHQRMGASTITMQVARLCYGINSKTISGKILQMIRALQLELHYSKDQILAAYLNLAPYGSNIEGVGAASLIYFNKPVNALSLSEALTLAVIPQNPIKRVPNRGILKSIRSHLYARWVKTHPRDKDQQTLMNLPLQIRSIHSIPFLAPHFVNDVLADDSLNQNQIITTLNLSLQQIIERVTRQYIDRKVHLGVNNAAVLLIDTRDMKVKAMLGSADFFNSAINGQINGTHIKRSPGSTLKPFIYALALDQGLIHPATLLKDVPHRFGSYNPENFDNDFVGPIKAKNALILSRNIPAITLAEQLRHPTLYEFLQQAGISELKPESYYGLALVLGGAELTMQELVGLYAALINDGIWKPLRFAEPKPGSKRLFSPEASFLVLDMLKETALPSEIMVSKSWSISWKTGTSSGYRDAWTIGTFGPYVLAVWIGNFNNQANPIFVGKEIAAPLFFDIIHALPFKGQFLSSLMPPSSKYLNLTQVDVCKVSGMLPNRYCGDTEKVWFIPGKSPIKIDTIHREIAINSKTGFRACQFDETTRFEIYEFWSSDLLKIFKRAGIQRRIPPLYDAHCSMGSKKGDGFAPQIISPQTQVNYITRRQSSSENSIPFTAVVDADVRKIYWFLNSSFLGETTRDKTFLWRAKPGNYVVRIVDDYGRSDVSNLHVIMKD